MPHSPGHGVPPGKEQNPKKAKAAIKHITATDRSFSMIS